MATNGRPAASVDPDVALAYKFPEVSFAYDERDVALYALGVGACGADAVDDKELHLVHHRDGQRHIKALPTFVSLFPNKNSNGRGIVNVPGIHFDESLLLHGQQYIEIYKPIPSCASVVNKVKVAGLHDKGKATILEIETTTSLKDSGEVVCDMAISFESSSFLSVKIQRSDYINAGVLFSCVVREVFRTLPGHTRIRLILPTRFLAFLFQILHLPQCMKTRHNNPRHSCTDYLGIIILCIQTLWLHRLQGSPVQYCTASALWGSRPGRSSSHSATGIQRQCGTSSAGSCCTSTPAKRWSPRCGSTARGCSTRPRRKSVTAPCFPDTCCSNTSPHHCLQVEKMEEAGCRSRSRRVKEEEEEAAAAAVPGQLTPEMMHGQRDREMAEEQAGRPARFCIVYHTL